MIVTNGPFATHHGAAHSRADSAKAEGGRRGPRAANGAPGSSNTAQAAGLAEGDKGKSVSSPAHQAKALADAQAALDGQQAKLPFGHIVRLFARGDADAAAALFAPQDPDGGDGVGETSAVVSTDESGLPGTEDEDVADAAPVAPPMAPADGERADPEFAPELGEGDALAALIDELLDAPGQDGGEVN